MTEAVKMEGLRCENVETFVSAFPLHGYGTAKGLLVR